MSRVGLRGTAVTKRFGRVAALRGIDFAFEPGESVAILGANGAGKSTLLRILAGLSRASSGDFEARSLAAGDTPLAREALRREIGYVGHATLLHAELTAAENLVFAARLAGAAPPPDEITRLLETVGLAEVAARRAGTFSRGMSQRLAIARAIVHEPSILLLDEPFTGLDEVSAERLSRQLTRFRDGAHTVILVTHDPRRAIELADRALILHRGEIVGRPAAGEGADGGGSFDADSLRETLARVAGADAGRAA